MAALTCAATAVALEKYLPQCEHMYGLGLSSWWVSMCCLRPLERKKVRGQAEASPLGVVVCVRFLSVEGLVTVGAGVRLLSSVDTCRHHPPVLNIWPQAACVEGCGGGLIHCHSMMDLGLLWYHCGLHVTCVCAIVVETDIFIFSFFRR